MKHVARISLFFSAEFLPTPVCHSFAPFYRAIKFLAQIAPPPPEICAPTISQHISTFFSVEFWEGTPLSQIMQTTSGTFIPKDPPLGDRPNMRESKNATFGPYFGHDFAITSEFGPKFKKKSAKISNI